jgi:hypothetical protein
MYTAEEISLKRYLAERLSLSQRELLANPTLVKKCNGIGAEWMWDNLRDIISTMNPTLVLAADIHDCAYELGGTEDDREFADLSFLENAIKLAEYKYAWYNPIRYRVKKQAYKFYSLLKVFGKYAFNYKEN